MPQPGIRQPIAAEALAQRAIAAWKRLDGRAEPSGFETLQEENARSVLRLLGVGPAGAPVIAKRCQLSVAVKERSIYEEILPHLSFPSLRLHGFLPEPKGRYAWLFLEDAGGEPYDPGRRDHRVLAGRWLGRLHTAAAKLCGPALPDRGPIGFRQDPARICEALHQARPQPLLGEGDVEVLDRILALCRVLATHWSELEDFCSGLPKTLAHGDFKQDNMRVRPGETASDLVLFDWHEAGWGAPALDVAKFLGYSVDPDLEAYLDVIRAPWPEMDRAVIRRLAWVGEALRAIASTRWEVEKLFHKPPEVPMTTLRIYLGWLGQVVRAEPWAEEASAGPAARRPKPRSWV